MNSVITRRVGTIGFSQPAEAFENWGRAGVVGFMFVIGLVLSWIDRSPKRVWSLLARNSVLVPLLYEVRNAFSPVPGQIVIGLALSAGVLLLARHQRARAGAGRSGPETIEVPALV
jgi:hypothetical protein